MTCHRKKVLMKEDDKVLHIILRCLPMLKLKSRKTLGLRLA